MNKKGAKASSGLASQRGFTLVELMITMAVMGVLLTSLSLIMRDSIRAWYSQSKRLEMVRQARLAMDVITKQVHSGSAATVEISRYSASSPQLPYSMLSFERWDRPGLDTRFYLRVLTAPDGTQNAVLIFEDPKVIPGATPLTVVNRIALANGVANLTFTYPDASMDNRIMINLGLLRRQYEQKLLTHQLKEIVEFKNP